jgi:hypothetical protein
VTPAELLPSELLGAASAWASSHPSEAPGALLAVLAAANVGPADLRRADATRALAAALGPDYADGPLTDRLAELAAIDGPRGVAAALRAAAALAERWELRQAAKGAPEPGELTRDEAKAERRTARLAWGADPDGMTATAGESLGPLAASITADYCRRFAAGPSRDELAAKLGIPSDYARAVLAAMVDAGWLAAGPDGLRAGPRWVTDGAGWAAGQTAAGHGPAGWYIGHAPKRAKAGAKP